MLESLEKRGKLRYAEALQTIEEVVAALTEEEREHNIVGILKGCAVAGGTWVRSTHMCEHAMDEVDFAARSSVR